MIGLGWKTEKRIEQEIERGKNEQKENQLKWHSYLIAVLMTLIGLVFIIYKEINISFVCTVFAVVFAIAGIISVVTYCVKDVTSGYYRLDLAYGIMSVFAALLFYLKQDLFEVYFPVIAGCILVMNGVIKLQHSIDMKRIDKRMKKVTEIWLVIVIFSLACIVTGCIVVFATLSDERKLFLLIGIAFVVAGITDVLTHIAFNNKVRTFRIEREHLSEESEKHVNNEPKDNPADAVKAGEKTAGADRTKNEADKQA